MDMIPDDQRVIGLGLVGIVIQFIIGLVLLFIAALLLLLTLACLLGGEYGIGLFWGFIAIIISVVSISLLSIYRKFHITFEEDTLTIDYNMERKIIQLKQIKAWESRMPLYIHILMDKRYKLGPMPKRDIMKISEGLTAWRIKQEEEAAYKDDLKYSS